MDLSTTTAELLTICEDALQRFERARALQHEPDFFTEVRPYVTHYDTVLATWKEAVLNWIADAKPLYVHPTQIESVVESMMQFLVQSFYPKTGRKRFVQTIQSTQYTLKTILTALHEERTENGC